MTRDQALSLLRERTRRDDVVDLLARRHPAAERPEELVPLAIGLMLESDDLAERIAHVIPEMTEPCRNVLRLLLQGKGFDEISEELDIDSVDAYTRCRRRLFPSSRPIPEYAAGTADTAALFEQALEDQATFNSVRDEHTLLELIRGSPKRAQLLEATEHVRFTIGGTLREWFDRPRSKILLAVGVLAWIAVAVKQCGAGR